MTHKARIAGLVVCGGGDWLSAWRASQLMGSGTFIDSKQVAAFVVCDAGGVHLCENGTFGSSALPAL